MKKQGFNDSKDFSVSKDNEQIRIMENDATGTVQNGKNKTSIEDSKRKRCPNL
jgi:hypothetical protein